MVLGRLQTELLQPKSLTYITSALGKAVSAALNKRPDAQRGHPSAARTGEAEAAEPHRRHRRRFGCTEPPY